MDRILWNESVGGDWLLQALADWKPSVEGLVWRLLGTVIIVIIGMHLIRLMSRLLEKAIARTNLDMNVARFLQTVANALMYAILIFIAAERLGVPSSSILALLGSAGLAVGLSLKESLNNVAGGILIMVTRPFVLGDYIVCGESEGTVTDIGLVYTTLAAIDNRKITIPNGVISNATVINFTAQEKRQLDLAVSVSYESDMKKAKEVLTRILETHPHVIREDGVRVFVKELGESAVIFGIRGWIRTEEYWPSRWDIIESIKLRFDEEGIQIPYNQMDIHMKG